MSNREKLMRYLFLPLVSDVRLNLISDFLKDSPRLGSAENLLASTACSLLKDAQPICAEMVYKHSKDKDCLLLYMELADEFDRIKYKS